MTTDYFSEIYKSMTRQHYERGGWYSVNGQRLTLEQALDTRQPRIHFPGEPPIFRGALQKNMIKSYPPSLWAHGSRTTRGKRVNAC